MELCHNVMELELSGCNKEVAALHSYHYIHRFVTSLPLTS